MKNIRFLSRHVDRKKSTQYVVFFEHKGAFARIDWELSDSAGNATPEVVSDMMLLQLGQDIENKSLMNEVRRQNAENPESTIDNRVESYIEDGFVEHNVSYFKVKAMEMFGNE